MPFLSPGMSLWGCLGLESPELLLSSRVSSQTSHSLPVLLFKPIFRAWSVDCRRFGSISPPTFPSRHLYQSPLVEEWALHRKTPSASSFVAYSKLQKNPWLISSWKVKTASSEQSSLRITCYCKLAKHGNDWHLLAIGKAIEPQTSFSCRPSSRDQSIPNDVATFPKFVTHIQFLFSDPFFPLPCPSFLRFSIPPFIYSSLPTAYCKPAIEHCADC